jgi:hypothetical protein
MYSFSQTSLELQPASPLESPQTPPPSAAGKHACAPGHWVRLPQGPLTGPASTAPVVPLLPLVPPSETRGWQAPLATQRSKLWQARGGVPLQRPHLPAMQKLPRWQSESMLQPVTIPASPEVPPPSLGVVRGVDGVPQATNMKQQTAKTRTRIGDGTRTSI